MKIQFEVTDVTESRVTFKPINCPMKGHVTFQLPRRAAEMCKVGDRTEASLNLPDQYPLNDSVANGLLRALRDKMGMLLHRFPKARCFGALAGLENGIEGVGSILSGQGSNASASGAGGLVQYAKSFYEMAQTHGDMCLVAEASEVLKLSSELLLRMNIKPWETLLG
jgi:hypothetical protein